jgi:hypothetical protein
MKYLKFRVKNQNKKTIIRYKKTSKSKKDRKRSRRKNKNKNNQNQCIRINKTSTSSRHQQKNKYLKIKKELVKVDNNTKNNKIAANSGIILWKS